MELNREQLIDVAILMGTDFNSGIDGVGPKRGLKLVQEFGKAEGALEKLGKEIKNLEEIRSLFLEHPFVEFTPEWKTPNVELDGWKFRVFGHGLSEEISWNKKLFLFILSIEDL